MRRGTNSIEVKRFNRNRVFRYVNSAEKVSMPEIASTLNMSSPTVLQIVNELKQAHLVKEVGEFSSTGGRKAKAIAAVKDAKFAVGLDITRNHMTIVITDMTRTVLKHDRIQKPFVYNDAYFRETGEFLDDYLKKADIPEDRIQGVGISLPAIIDGSHNFIRNSRVLNLFDIPGSDITKHIPYHCILINDANAGLFGEYSQDMMNGSMVYLSLSNSVGGAVVYGEDQEYEEESLITNLWRGDNWKAGEFGHMVIHPGGKLCYCGKRGCLDAYCSALVLADRTDGDLERFFAEMEAGNAEFAEIFETYLDDLAIAVDNLRMCFDCRVVLGGYVGSYIGPYLGRLRKKLAGKAIFDEDTGTYVRACTYKIEASALGAAALSIEEFIDSI